MLVTAAILICAGQVFSWDEVGHKLTAYIAWEQMTPAAREKAFDILMSAPENSDLNVPYDAFNSRSEAVKRRELFMFASIWPDVIRDRKFETRHKIYNNSNWHYSDIFWRQEGEKAVVLEKFDGDGGIAIPKLYEFEKILSNPGSPDSEKSIALAWFLHVGGDIHNPLHNASRVTDTEPKGDQGGNLVTLRPGDAEGRGRLNLHGYWDSIIGRQKPRKDDACDIDYLAPIARKFMRKYRFPRLQESLFLGDYKKWNQEGFEMLSTKVYTPTLIRGQMPAKRYQKNTYRIAEAQIALAGYRLGETLNRVLGNSVRTE